jgi:hypothetical protein
MDLTPIPVGGDTQVNTTTSTYLRTPAVTALADGGYLVTWTKWIGEKSYGVYGQRYAADGTPVGAEFLANNGGMDTGNGPAVAALNDGGYVVTWYSWGQAGEGGSLGVYGQRFAADGSKIGAEFHVNTYTYDNQYVPSITALDDGGFFVTWSSGSQDSFYDGVYARRYAADGTAVGSEFRVNSTTANNQTYPSVTKLSDGSLVVTWMSRNQDGSGYGIYGQRLAPDGALVGEEFRVNTTATHDQLWSSVTSLENGGFVVTWASDGQDGSGFGIYGQRYAGDGTSLGGEFHISTYTSGNQTTPDVVALDDGGFVVAWSSNGQDGSGWGLYGQRFAADGTKAGTEFAINQITSGDQESGGYTGLTTLAVLPNGNLVQVWEGPGDQQIYSRTFDVPPDTVGPTLSSFVQTDSSQTDLGQVHYTLTFSEPVTGVAADQFTLITTGVTGASIASVDPVSGSNGKQYTVTVNTGSGDGTIAIDLTGSDVKDYAGNPLASDGTFGSPTTYATTSGPQGIALADFNGDGHLDMATPDYTTASVSVRLGNGDGTFGARTTLAAGSAPTFIAASDLNGDGNQDLAVVNYTHQITILLGNGDGTFQAGSGYGVHTQPRSLAIGDLNGDGVPDVAVANVTSYPDPADNFYLSVLIGNGDGTFQSQVKYIAGAGPISVAMGDLDGDGNLDLAAANVYGNSVSVFLGNGDGTIQAPVNYAAGTNPAGVAIGDLNSDGNLDVVVGNATSSTVSVFLGNGDGTLASQVTYAAGAGADDVTLSDLNGDSHLDMVVANNQANSGSVFLGVGDGTFLEQVTYSTGPNPTQIAVGDVNEDGRPDLVTSVYSANTVSIRLGDLAPAPAYTIDKNDAPSGTDNTLTILEDTPHVFTAADFGFSDANDTPLDTLAAVKITTLPLLGALLLAGEAVTANQFVSATDIAAGHLTYAPALNANGLAPASFTFQVQDNGGTEGGGIDLDPTPNTLSFNVTPVNDAPVVTADDQLLTRNLTVPASSLFEVTDADSDAIQYYQFFDNGRGAGSGVFLLDGVTQATGQEILVEAADLASLEFRVADVGSDDLYVRAFDGVVWSDWTGFTISTANSAPVVTAENQTLPKGVPVAASELFEVTDADSDAIQYYQFFDNGRGAGSGVFLLNDVPQATGQEILVAAADLASLEFKVATVGSDDLYVRAFDGVVWSDWTGFTISTANSAPVVTAENQTLPKGVPVAASELFEVTDADSDAIQYYQFFDNGRGADSGVFLLNDVPQATGQEILVAAADLASFEFRVAEVGSDDLYVRAFDGANWSEWTGFTISTANSAPVVTAENQTLPKGVPVAASELFEVTDADSDAIQYYQFFDNGRGADSGVFLLIDVPQATGQEILVAAADLASLEFKVATVGSDDLYVRAFDGANWSDWTGFTISTANSAPVVTAENQTLPKGVPVAASELFEVTDADSDAIQYYQFFDNGRGAESGIFLFNDVPQPTGQEILVEAADLASFEFQVAEVGSDDLYVRAFDGVVWSDWTGFTVTATDDIV